MQVDFASRRGLAMPQPNREEDRDASGESPVPPRVLRSEELFAGQRIIVIEHDGEHYRLMITRNNRLLLQK